MSNINPLGIDQTTGQQKPISSSDSIVNNIGSQIRLGVIQTGDYSQQSNLVNILYPWSSPQKLADPASAPSQNSIAVEWSPNTEYLATTHNSPSQLEWYQRVGSNLYFLSSPATMAAGDVFDISWSLDGQFLATAGLGSLNIFQKSGNILTRISDPASMPGFCYGVDFSPNGEFLACMTSSIPSVFIYQRNGTTFTKISDPASIPDFGDNGKIKFSPNGEFLALHGNNGANTQFYVYQRTGVTTFTKLTDPTTMQSSSAQKIDWSPDSQYLVVAGGSAPFIYKRSGTSFIKLNQPNSLPATTSGCTWSPDGNYLSFTFDMSPYIGIYQRNGDVFTLLSDPASLPTGQGLGNHWSNNGQFLAVGHVTAPFLTIYQTSGGLPDSGVMVTQGT